MVFLSIDHEALFDVSFNSHMKLVEGRAICDILLYVDRWLFIHICTSNQSCECEEHGVCRLCLFSIKQLQLYRIISCYYKAIQICVTEGAENSVKQLLLCTTKLNLVATDVT